MNAGKMLSELKHHAPFTGFGALVGVVLMMLFKDIGHETARKVFYFFHPLHIVLSAIVTASMYKIYECHTARSRCNFFMMVLIGFVGSIGIATLSDSIMPYLGERFLGLPHAEAHIGFIEEWPLVTVSALLGIGIANFWTRTEFPHAGHVLISTWASLFHMIMAMGGDLSSVKYAAITVFLFFSVWLPCCISDIIFPLLFIKNDSKI